MIRVILCGATGRMGSVMQALIAEGDTFMLSHAVAPSLGTSFSSFSGKADVVIDFSTPLALREELAFCEKNELPLVVGTTGHSEDAHAALEDAAQRVAIIKCENFSKGAYVLGNLAQNACQILGEGYDVAIVESHHRNKVDAPSGTAKRIAQMMDARVQTHSVRGGGLVGTHEVFFSGMRDRIILSHEALDRRLFAAGALDAARWIVHCSPGLYGMEDLLAGAAL